MKYLHLVLVIAMVLLVGCTASKDSLPPTEDTVPSDGDNVPSDGTCLEPRISYEEAINLLNEGKVSIISQSHTRCVTLELKNGTTYYALEENLDDIFGDFNQCGVACKDTGIGTE